MELLTIVDKIKLFELSSGSCFDEHVDKVKILAYTMMCDGIQGDVLGCLGLDEKWNGVFVDKDELVVCYDFCRNEYLIKMGTLDAQADDSKSNIRLKDTTDYNIQLIGRIPIMFPHHSSRKSVSRVG